MKSLDVKVSFAPGESRHVGRLVERENRLFFESDAEFLASPLWLSPFKLPPTPGVHEHKDRSFGPVFGVFDDSMPDGWGLLLMDRYFRQRGVAPEGMSVLDRLSYMGNHAMGALTYHPSMEDGESSTELLDLHGLAGEAYRVMSGDAGDVLPALLRAGGSPAGARPKVLVGVKGDQVVSGEGDLPEGYDQWLVKFFAKAANRDEGRVEYAYSMMAKSAGIAVPEARLFHTREGDAFFGVERFDRDGSRRVHIHSFGNMIHSNFRIPGCDYEMLLRVTRILTKSHRDIVAAFRIMVFNVLSHNRDDHVKNFSYIMDRDGVWHLSPAYDMTFSHGPGGQHSMTVAGEGVAPGRSHMLKLAAGAGIEPPEALGIIEEVMESVSRWKRHAAGSGVGEQRIREIGVYIRSSLSESRVFS